MSISSIAFSATISPFYSVNYGNGNKTNFAQVPVNTQGNVSINTAPGVTGHTNATVVSSITANGQRFEQKSATFNGDQLTISYQTSGINQGITNPQDFNLSGNGVTFTPTATATSGNNNYVSYDIQPNGQFNYTLRGAALSNTTSNTNEHITLKDIAVVGNSIVATYKLADTLPNNTDLAPHGEVPAAATVTVTTPNLRNDLSGATFNSNGLQTIGDVLAASSGISVNGTRSSPLQQPPDLGKATAVPHPNAALAAILNPTLNLTPDKNLHTTDFINVALDAYPTRAPQISLLKTDTTTPPGSNQTPNNRIDITQSGKSQDNQSPTGNNGYGSDSGTGGGSTATFDGSQSVGIYSAIANASASNIRGTGVNTVA